MLTPLLLETAKEHKMEKTQILTVTEMKVKTLLLQKEREGRHLERAELNRLSHALWRKRRALKREKNLECRDGESSQEDTKRAFQLENEKILLTSFFSKTSTQSLQTKWSSPEQRGLTV